MFVYTGLQDFFYITANYYKSVLMSTRSTSSPTYEELVSIIISTTILLKCLKQEERFNLNRLGPWPMVAPYS